MVSGSRNPTQTSSSSKNAYPSLRTKECFRILDFSVGPAMFFSRRWMLCSGSEVRNHRLNCYEKYAKSAKLPDEVINEQLLFKCFHGRVFRDMYKFKVHELSKITHHLGSDI